MSLDSNRSKGMKATKPKRTGAWTPPEKIYADQVVAGFHEGWLDVEEGTTLRGLLSTLLNCDPKRVSKRMENSDYNGRKSFQRKTSFSKEELEAKRANLQEWKEKFEQSVEELRRARLGLFDCDGILSGSEETSTTQEPMAKAMMVAPSSSAAKAPVVTVSNMKATRDTKTDASFLATEMTSEKISALLLEQGNLGDDNQALLGLLGSITGLSNKSKASASIPVASDVPSKPAPQPAPQSNDLQGLLQLLGSAPGPMQASAQHPNMASASSAVPATMDCASILSQLQQQNPPPAPAQTQPKNGNLGMLSNLCGNSSTASSSVLPQQVASHANAVTSASVAPPALTIEDLLKQIQNQASSSQVIVQPVLQGTESQGSASNGQAIASLMTSLGCNNRRVGVSSVAPPPTPPLSKPQACVTFEDLLGQIQGLNEPAPAQKLQAGNAGRMGQTPRQNKPALDQKPQAAGSDLATLLTTLAGNIQWQSTVSNPGFSPVPQDLWNQIQRQVAPLAPPPTQNCQAAQGPNNQGRISAAPMNRLSAPASGRTTNCITNTIFSQMNEQSIRKPGTARAFPVIPPAQPTCNGYTSTPSTPTQMQCRTDASVAEMLSNLCSKATDGERQGPVPQTRNKQPDLAQQLEGLLSGASATNPACQEDVNLVNSLKRVLEQHESQSNKRFKVLDGYS